MDAAFSLSPARPSLALRILFYPKHCEPVVRTDGVTLRYQELFSPKHYSLGIVDGIKGLVLSLQNTNSAAEQERHGVHAVLKKTLCLFHPRL
jgi:hypothetical protein